MLENLVTLQPPLNDDIGMIIANILHYQGSKPQEAHSTQCQVRNNRVIVLYLVASKWYRVYVLWEPILFIYERFTQEERAHGNELSMEESVRGIGKVQSPQRTSKRPRTERFPKLAFIGLFQ